MERKQEFDKDADFVAALTAGQDALTMVVRALMPGESCIEEVIQRTNAKLWEKRSDFHPGTNFLAWSSAFVRFEILNFRKQQARDSRLTFSDELEGIIAREMPPLLEQLSDRKQALRLCLAKLPQKRRELLLSRYRGDVSIEQMAASLGRSVGGLRVTLSRLREKLAQCIQRTLQTDEGHA